MSDAGPRLANQLTPEETTAVLQHILKAVEKDERTRWVELCCAVVLSLATMSSAWCAYQATLWSGVQTFRLAAAQKAGRDSTTSIIAALQYQAFDASMFISFMQAKYEGNERQEAFLFKRFRPEMKKAVEAWMKTDPFNDPSAPQGPLKMPEYHLTELDDAKRANEQFAQEHAAAERANENSDTYVLLTVLFASVLFFGGIAGTLDSHRLRVAILIIALVFFAISVGFLATMPICRE